MTLFYKLRAIWSVAKAIIRSKKALIVLSDSKFYIENANFYCATGLTFMPIGGMILIDCSVHRHVDEDKLTGQAFIQVSK